MNPAALAGHPGRAAALAAVLDEAARALDGSPESPYAGAAPGRIAAALRAERDALLKTGRLRDRAGLRALFLPTGKIQDTAIDADWGDAYLDLASRFDAALAAYVASVPGAT